MATVIAPRDKPSTFVGHAVIAFGSQAQATHARLALADIGYTGEQVRHWTETEMLGQLKAAIHRDRRHAGLPCSDGYDHDALAVRHSTPQAQALHSHHWLIVRVKNEARAQQVLDHVLCCEPRRARHYQQAGFIELMASAFPSSLPWPSSLAVARE